MKCPSCQKDLRVMSIQRGDENTETLFTEEALMGVLVGAYGRFARWNVEGKLPFAPIVEASTAKAASQNFYDPDKDKFIYDATANDYTFELQVNFSETNEILTWAGKFVVAPTGQIIILNCSMVKIGDAPVPTTSEPEA